MKPYSRNNGIIRVKNRRKYNAVSRKKRRTGFKVANPTSFWDIFSTRGSVILKRMKKARGLLKDTFREFYIDKI